MVRPRRLIGEAMLEEGLITKKQLEEASYYGELLVDDDAEAFAGYDFRKWLIFIASKNASDLHLIAGMPPWLRIYGELMPLRLEPLSDARIKELVYSILTKQEIEAFEQDKAMDKSFEIPGVSRYRVNLHWQKDSIGASIRALPIDIPNFNDLGLPEILKDFALRPSGLVLLTGPAGCGKSTTLAAMIEFINLTRSVNVVTIEDPIEYIFTSEKSLIRQRELGRDTLSFYEALRSVVRQDPNIILIGEMRDLETIQAALTLAETGHLVLSTLHTQDAAHAITRIVDVFPLAHQHEVRTKLSLTLQGVIVQQLIPRMDKKGRVLACEILNCIPSIRSLIRENNLAQLRSFIQMGKKNGMRSMNQSLNELYRCGAISWEDACLRSNDRDELLQLV